jgi:peroxiredoxin
VVVSPSFGAGEAARSCIPRSLPFHDRGLAMSRLSTLLAAITLAGITATAGAQSATQAGAATATPPAGPDVGQVAPDFTAAWADSAGARGTPVSLAALRGKVVVLPISADSIPSHVSWASEAKFPFALVSDPQLAAADLYGSHVAGRPVANRTVYVVGRDGRVAYREMKFNALNEDAYTALAAAVAKAR